MGIRPMYDRVLIKRAKQEEHPSGLYVPDTAKEKPNEGEIVAVGDGRLLDNGDCRPMKFLVGERVLFPKYGGIELKHEDIDYVIVTDSDILAILD